MGIRGFFIFSIPLLILAGGCVGEGTQPTVESGDETVIPLQDTETLLDWPLSTYEGDIALRIHAEPEASDNTNRTPHEEGYPRPVCELSYSFQGRSDSGLGAWIEWAWTTDGIQQTENQTTAGWFPYAHADKATTNEHFPLSFVWRVANSLSLPVDESATILLVAVGLEPNSNPENDGINEVSLRCTEGTDVQIAMTTEHVFGFTDSSLEGGVGIGTGNINMNYDAGYEEDLPTDQIAVRIEENNGRQAVGTLVLSHPSGTKERTFGNGAMDPVRVHDRGGEIHLEIDRMDTPSINRPGSLKGFVVGLDDMAPPWDDAPEWAS